jgi:hypothetical protein
MPKHRAEMPPITQLPGCHQRQTTLTGRPKPTAWRTRPHVLWGRSAGRPARGRLARMPGGLWPQEGAGRGRRPFGIQISRWRTRSPDQLYGAALSQGTHHYPAGRCPCVDRALLSLHRPYQPRGKNPLQTFFTPLSAAPHPRGRRGVHPLRRSTVRCGALTLRQPFVPRRDLPPLLPPGLLPLPLLFPGPPSICQVLHPQTSAAPAPPSAHLHRALSWPRAFRFRPPSYRPPLAPVPPSGTGAASR